MSNMGYCRFENTVADLEDCYDHMGDKDLSESERKYRTRMIELCADILNDYGDLED